MTPSPADTAGNSLEVVIGKGKLTDQKAGKDQNQNISPTNVRKSKNTKGKTQRTTRENLLGQRHNMERNKLTNIEGKVNKTQV